MGPAPHATAPPPHARTSGATAGVRHAARFHEQPRGSARGPEERGPRQIQIEHMQRPTPSPRKMTSAMLFAPSVRPWWVRVCARCVLAHSRLCRSFQASIVPCCGAVEGGPSRAVERGPSRACVPDATQMPRLTNAQSLEGQAAINRLSPPRTPPCSPRARRSPPPRPPRRPCPRRRLPCLPCLPCPPCPPCPPRRGP